MVRNYKKKTDRCSINEESISHALREVLDKRMSIRMAAQSFAIKKSTLYDRVKIALKNNGNDSGTEDNIDIRNARNSKYGSRQVFSMQNENLLVKYLKTSSNIHYGLTFKTCRSLAYEYANSLNLKYPSQWDIAKTAGKEWMRSFMVRHPELSYRKPENTSLARASAFNKHNVDSFFENYITIQRKYKFTPDRIFNTDETGVTTVLQAPRIIAPAGKKQVGQIVSAERGTLVTVCATVSATGFPVPPMYIFPRVRMKDSFLNNSVPGAIGHTSKSGWVNADIFLSLLEHIKKHTNSSPTNQLLLLLDNHEAHTSLAAVNFCRQNGIVLLTFPPHCTHRMQPLDVGLFGPFKTRCKVSFNDFMASNPGRQISIYDIAGLTAQPYSQSFNSENIIKAFEKTGIWPINRSVFQDSDFSASFATDRPVSSDEKASCSKDAITPKINIISNVLIRTGKEANEVVQYCLETILDNVFRLIQRHKGHEIQISPFSIRPLPKAPPRKNTGRRSKLGKSRIVTSTPEKKVAEELEEIRNAKKKKKIEAPKLKQFSEDNRKRTLVKMDMKTSKNKICRKGKKEIDSSSSSDSEIDDIDVKSTSGDSDIEVDFDPGDPEEIVRQDQPVEVGDYLLVKFPTKKIVRHYVGLVLSEDSFEYSVKFLRRNGPSQFIFPNVDDIALVTKEDVVWKLPKPDNVVGTSRSKSLVRFSVSFDTFNVM